MQYRNTANSAYQLPRLSLNRGVTWHDAVAVIEPLLLRKKFGPVLNEIADLGVTLLLLSIGLKVRIGQLLRAEVLGVASLPMLAIFLLSTGVLPLLGVLNFPVLDELTPLTAVLLGFALSFSSTVFTVKRLEDKDDMSAWYGRIAIGVLIVQDIAAVIVLGVSAAKVPAPSAAMIIVAIIASRPLLAGVLHRAGHGELLVLFGLVLALGGASLFEMVDLKGDLGALGFGVLLSGHPKATELFRSLLSVKDLFLVGFFLSIGMAGIPEVGLLLVAVLLVLAVPIKTGFYLWLLTRFRVRIRPAALASQSLSNFIDFSLIVGSIAVANGCLHVDWLVVIAVAVAMSFIAASALNFKADNIYSALRSWQRRFERDQRLVGDEQTNGLRSPSGYPTARCTSPSRIARGNGRPLSVSGAPFSKQSSLGPHLSQFAAISPDCPHVNLEQAL